MFLFTSLPTLDPSLKVTKNRIQRSTNHDYKKCHSKSFTAISWGEIFRQADEKQKFTGLDLYSPLSL